MAVSDTEAAFLFVLAVGRGVAANLASGWVLGYDAARG